MLRSDHSTWASFLVAAALGCGDGKGDDSTRSIPDLVEELHVERDRWLESQPEAYVFVGASLCFCGFRELRGIRTSVRDGKVVSAVGVSSGLPQEESVDLTALFDEAIAAAEDAPDQFDVEYDDTYGFLRRYSVDYDEGIADDELVRAVDCFSEDTSDDQCPIATRTAEWCTEKGGAIAPIDGPRSCDLIPESPGPGVLLATGRINGEDAVCCLEFEQSLHVTTMEIDQQR